jgi:hypothetical protein
VKCPAPCILTLDASPTAEPTLTSLAFVPASSLFVVFSDTLSFSPPSSGFAGAQLQLTSSSLALPVLIPNTAAASPKMSVRALLGDAPGTLPPGAVVEVAVREVAPGCLPGPPHTFSCTVDYVLLAPTLDDAALGNVLPGGSGPQTVFALSGTTIGVMLPGGGGTVVSARGLLILTRSPSGGSGGGGSGGGDHPLQLRVQPDPRGIAQVRLRTRICVSAP